MKREHINKIRYILEEILPPIIRDSFIFKYLFRQYMRNQDQEKLKSNIINISKKKYDDFYKDSKRLRTDSDLSQICVDEILKNIKPNSVIDVGCGNGFLLKKIQKKFKKLSLYGTEINVPLNFIQKFKNYGIKIKKMRIEELNKSLIKYDTVICTHVLEHILDINLAYLNLKKICKKRLIIIVPRERPYKHTLNAHIHFFPYKESFINTIRPKQNYKIKDLNRDLIYVENIN